MDKKGTSASSYAVLGLAFIIVGSALGCWSYLEYEKSHWPTAVGKIIRTRIEKTVVYVDHESSSDEEDYRLDSLFVDYQYFVDKKKYVGDELHHKDKRYLYEKPMNYKHLLNKEVIVYYNPSEPKFSTLKVHGKYILASVFGSAFGVIFGVLFMLHSIAIAQNKR